MSDLTPEEIEELSPEERAELGLDEAEQEETEEAEQEGPELNEDGLPIGVPLTDAQVRSQYGKSCEVSKKAKLDMAALNNKKLADVLKG